MTVLQYMGQISGLNQASEGVLSDIEIVMTSGGLRLLLTDASHNSLRVSNIDFNQGLVSELSNYSTTTQSASIHSVDTPDGTRVFLSGRTQSGVEATPLSHGGGLDAPQLLGTSESMSISALGVVNATEGQELIVISERGSASIRCYKTTQDGALEPFGQALELDGPGEEDISAIESVRVLNTTYIVAASATGHSVSTFRLSEGGSLEHVDSVGAVSGVGISAPTHIESVNVDGTDYVIVSSINTSSLTVFELTLDGNLNVTDQINDSISSQFQRLSEFSVAKVGDRVFISAAGEDGGVSLLSLLPGGELVHLADTSLNGYSPAQPFSEITSREVNGQLEIFALEAGTNNISHFRVDVSNIGATLMSGDLSAATSGDDVIVGTSSDDLLEGGEGSDILVGSGGSDRLVGGDGRDLFVVHADGVEDHIVDFEFGLDTIDLFHWGRIYDIRALDVEPLADGIRIRFQEQSLQITSRSGDPITVAQLEDMGLFDVWRVAAIEQIGDNADVLDPPEPGREIRGTDADDTLIGGEGDDLLIGGLGDDLLDGTLGNDTLQGESGNDTYYVQSWGDKVVESAADGWDTVVSTVSFRSEANVERLTLLGHNHINAYGSAGNDVLIGNAGNNSIEGAAGNDFIDGGLGDDELIGGFGDDTYVIGSWRDNVVEAGGSGYDVLLSYTSYRAILGVEELRLMGTSNLNAYGNNEANFMSGNSGHNSLRGAGGDDRLLGGDGNDMLDGGVGADIMEGGAGNDTYIVDRWSDRVQEAAGGGWDSILANVSYRAIAHVERLTLSGDANINAYGTNLGDVLVGNTGQNYLEGGRGNDRLDGGAGVDFMVGGEGDDTYIVGTSFDTIVEAIDEGHDHVFAYADFMAPEFVEDLTLAGSGDFDATGNEGSNSLRGNSGDNRLTGGAGDDTLSGGAGADVLTGDAGHDVFVFDAALSVGNADTIADFEIGTDQIALDSGIFGLAQNGYLHSSAFGIGSAAWGANQRVIYNPQTGELSYDGDGSGADAATVFAQLDTGLALEASDFLTI